LPHIKYLTDNTGGILVNNQLVAVLIALSIAIGCANRNKLSGLLFAAEYRFDLIAQIPQMVVVHQGAKVEHIGVVTFTVQTVQNRHKAASQRGENNVRISSHFYIIPAQA